VTATAFEVATRMITTFYPEVDITKRAMLIRAAIFDLIEARNVQELEQVILKIAPTDGK